MPAPFGAGGFGLGVEDGSKLANAEAFLHLQPFDRRCFTESIGSEVRASDFECLDCLVAVADFVAEFGGLLVVCHG